MIKLKTSNMKTKIKNILFYGIFSSIFLVISSCDNSKNPEIIQANPEYAEYVSAYTSGVISNNADIVIELKEDLSNDEIEKLEDAKLFEFEPFIDGKYTWINNRTIRFKPSEELESMILYSATFHLSKVTVVPSDMLDFKFQFQSKYMDLTVYLEGLTPYSDNLEWQKVNGILTTSDNVSPNMIERVVSANQKGKNLKIN